MLRIVAGLVALVAASVAWAEGPTCGSPASPDEAKVERILGEIMAVRVLPAFDRTKEHDADYVRDYESRLRAALERRVDLIGELHRLAPDHPLIHELMWKRWSAMMHRLLAGRKGELVAEVEKLTEEKEDPLHLDATYLKALIRLPDAVKEGPDAVMAPIDAFIALAPKDERGAQLLAKVALLPNTPPERRMSIIDRVLAEYPESRTAANLKASNRRADGIGKPFDLSFREVTGGEPISVSEDAKGKVVVVEFWAKWCKPCLAEIPRMKQLYAQYKDKGVEFIGVSLDAPNGEGLEEIRAFIKENQLGWPQFAGKEASAFATAWGITQIPAVFVVDSKGNLHSHDARGRLETLIPELLKSR